MRIFKCIHQFLPKHVAGSEIHTYRLCKELMKRHAVHLFYPEHYDDRGPYQVRSGDFEGIPFTEFSYSAGAVDFRQTYRNARIEELFLEAFERFRPDVFHIQHLFFMTPRLIHLARERGVPVVMTLHEYGAMCPAGGLRMRPDYQLCHDIRHEQCADCLLDSPYVFRGPLAGLPRSEQIQLRACRNLRKMFETCGLGRWVPADPALAAARDRDAFMRECFAKVDLFLAPSRFLMKKYLEWGIHPDKIMYKDYGFDTAELLAVTREPAEIARFGYIGSVMPHKGVDVLVRAFNRLADSTAELRIFGEPSYHPPFYKSLQAEARHPGIRFEGFLPADRIPQAYSRIDALIVPSRWFENSPLTLHEALLAGVPVITSDLGGMKELITPGVNGLLFKTGDVDDLHRALQEYLTHQDRFKPSDIRNSMEIIDFRDYVNAVERLYERLVDGCSAPK